MVRANVWRRGRRVQPINATLLYVRMYGGGKGGKFTKRLIAFVNHCIKDNRYIASSTFNTLVGLRGFSSAEFCPNFMTAVHARSNSALIWKCIFWGGKHAYFVRQLHVAGCSQKNTWCSSAT